MENIIRKFEQDMLTSSEAYDNKMYKVFGTVLTCIPYVLPIVRKKYILRKKCKALIELDRQQINARLELIKNKAQYRKDFDEHFKQTAPMTYEALTKSAWFSGNNKSFY